MTESKGRVLLIDDEVDLLEMCGQVLRREG